MRFSLLNRITLLSYVGIYGALASSGGHTKYSPGSTEFWQCTAFCCVLVIFSGFCSGATQGLLSIDQLNLELKSKQGTQQEKEMVKQARTILPVLEQHHLLLSTLLISNASANESLPIFLHQLVPDWAAILISSIFVVLFGEVVPSAFTTGPDQLSIAVKLIPYVKILQSILYVICYPLSLFLDWILGIHNKTRYPIKDLRALLQLHASNEQKLEEPQTKQHQPAHSEVNKTALANEEIQLINSLMDLREDRVSKQSIDISKVFMVSSEEKFGKEFIRKLKIKGFSRVPVYMGDNKQQILGTFNLKSVLKYSEQDFGKPIRNLVQLTEPLIVRSDTSMLQMLMVFQEKRKTLAFIAEGENKTPNLLKSEDSDINSIVLNPRAQEIGRIIGILCLNDVFEEMLDVELKDDDIHGTLRQDIKVERKRDQREGVEKGLEELLLKK